VTAVVAIGYLVNALLLAEYDFWLAVRLNVAVAVFCWIGVVMVLLEACYGD
jgi:hypothetical protein